MPTATAAEPETETKAAVLTPERLKERRAEEAKVLAAFLKKNGLKAGEPLCPQLLALDPDALGRLFRADAASPKLATSVTFVSPTLNLDLLVYGQHQTLLASGTLHSTDPRYVAFVEGRFATTSAFEAAWLREQPLCVGDMSDFASIEKVPEGHYVEIDAQAQQARQNRDTTARATLDDLDAVKALREFRRDDGTYDLGALEHALAHTKGKGK